MINILLEGSTSAALAKDWRKLLIVQLLDDIQKPDLIVLHQFVGSTANNNSIDDQLDDKR